MSFGGSVAAMITSLKNNALPKRKRIFDRANHQRSSSIPMRKNTYKPPTPQELEAMEIQSKRVELKLLWIRVMALSLALAILGLVFYLLYLVYEMASGNHWEKYLF